MDVILKPMPKNYRFSTCIVTISQRYLPLLLMCRQLDLVASGLEITNALMAQAKLAFIGRSYLLPMNKILNTSRR